jgi:hypothetical protein
VPVTAPEQETPEQKVLNPKGTEQGPQGAKNNSTRSTHGNKMTIIRTGTKK